MQISEHVNGRFYAEPIDGSKHPSLAMCSALDQAHHPPCGAQGSTPGASKHPSHTPPDRGPSRHCPM